MKNERFIPNQRQYSKNLINVDDINVQGKKTTKITFSTDPVKTKFVRKYLPVDVYSLSLATEFCTRLHEIRLVLRTSPSVYHRQVGADNISEVLKKQ